MTPPNEDLKPTPERLKYLDNEPRRKMLFARDRHLNYIYDPYTPEELREMFGPYLEQLDYQGLDPREVRLIETVLWAWGEIVENTRPIPPQDSGKDDDTGMSDVIYAFEFTGVRYEGKWFVADMSGESTSYTRTDLIKGGDVKMIESVRKYNPPLTRPEQPSNLVGAKCPKCGGELINDTMTKVCPKCELSQPIGAKVDVEELIKKAVNDIFGEMNQEWVGPAYDLKVVMGRIIHNALTTALTPVQEENDRLKKQVSELNARLYNTQ